MDASSGIRANIKSVTQLCLQAIARRIKLRDVTIAVYHYAERDSAV